MPHLGWTLATCWLLLCACSFELAAATRTFLRAGTRYVIDHWETDDGLPENAVIAMTQTHDGYLWLGTLNGLVRFDGFRFTVHDEVNTPGLNSSRIFSLFEDRQSNLWIGTETDGLSLVKDGRVISLGIGRGRGARLAAAAEDATGAVWLYLVDGQLWRYRNGVTNAWFAGLSNVRTLTVENSGLLWVGTDRMIFAIRPAPDFQRQELPTEFNQPVRSLDYLLASRRGGAWRLADGHVQRWTTNHLERDFGEYPWKGARISTACEDLEGNLLVGTRGAGLYWFDPDGKATCLSTNQGLSHNFVLSLLVDREGTLWVGTDGGGLNRVKQVVFDVLEESAGLTVQSVGEDAQGGLWIGFNQIGPDANGAGYWKNGVFKWFGPGQGLMNASVWALDVDREQRVWAGTWGGLFQLQEERFQRVGVPEAKLPVVLAVHPDRRGRLWLGTQEGLFRLEEQRWKRFTIRDGLSAEVVRAIADDAGGNLWVGTEGGGLNLLTNGLFTSFRKQAEGLPSDDISSLHLDEEGVLWIGTFGSGLARFQGGRWYRYTTREGLISNSIGYLLEDGQGYLWIGSNAGLMRVKKQALNDLAQGRARVITVRAYGKPDGLPTRECTLGSQPGACRGRDGRLWFPTIRGLASVNPARLNPNINTNPPPVVIEEVRVEGQVQNTNSLRGSGPEVVTVPAGKEHIEIQYTSLNLAAPERARFRYWLEGHEREPVEAGPARFAHYSKLPPSRYRFHVTACNEDGVWNETGSTLTLIVEPPFWRTWWFLSAAVGGLLAAIIGAVHYVSTQRLQRQLEGMRQKEALEKERARIARDIHDQLGASLTQVSLLGEMVESDKHFPEEVEAHARQISQTARDTTRTLDEIVWTVNPSNDTLDGLINYVCKYAQEYLAVAGLRYRLDVPSELPAAPISPEVRHNVFLAAKEAITNVVRHAQATEVWVRLKLEPQAFTLEIQDNGRGPAGLEKPSAQTRNGLRNMRKRMEDIHGRFSIAPAAPGGSLVHLTAPLDKG
jgi:ligand-binding sensor domain-containing protein/signal transduction histidine kinase